MINILMDNQYYYSSVAGNTATMRIHGEIGTDVVGSVFAAELASLEARGITDITVQILSGGGKIVDGFAIFSALLNSKAYITTINDGIAASTAGWIFLAGKKALMRDYSYLMLHNPYSPDESAKGKERLAFMRSSILTIFQKRTGSDLKALGLMMDVETWVNAADAVTLGFATGIQNTELMANLNPEAQTVNQMFEICNSIIIKNDMTTNTEDLTTEDVTLTAEAIVAEVTNTDAEETQPEATDEAPAEAEVTPEPEDVPVAAEVDPEKAELVKVNAELMERLAKMEATVNSYQEAEKAKMEAEAKAKSLELVTNAVNLGKIAGDAKSTWMELANSNYDMAKSTLDAIQVTKVGTDIMNKVKTISPAVTTKTLRQLEKENPKEVARLVKEDFATYNQLYFNQYGTYPVK